MNLHCMQPIASATLNFYALWYLRQLFLSSVKYLQFMSECHVSVSKHQKNQQGHKRDKDECSSLTCLRYTIMRMPANSKKEKIRDFFFEFAGILL